MPGPSSPGDSVGSATRPELAGEFADGVSGVPEKEATGRIVKAHKGAFSRDGDLRAGWDPLRHQCTA
jgi:hypothetical protein